MENKFNKVISYLFAFILVLLFCLFVSYINKYANDVSINKLPTYVESNPALHVHEGDWFDSKYSYFTSKQIQDLKEIYISNHNFNNDVIAMISFSSGLLSKPVLKGDYSHLDWITGEKTDYGSVHTYNELGDSDIVIYGSYLSENISDDRTLYFTQLIDLKYVEQYENNKYLMLMGESEIIYYEVVDVNDGTWSYYSTNETINEDDNVLTLIVSGFESGEQEFIVCKEVGREASYNEQ